MVARPEASDVSSVNSSDYSASSSQNETQRRRRPAPATIGVDPANLVGKVLTRIRGSPIHPSLTLVFSDKTSFQVLVDGYDPTCPGIPKELEVSPSLEPFLVPDSRLLSTGLTIADCAIITMTDVAFEQKQKDGRRWEDRWNQDHLGVAFKFAEGNTWHGVWATMAEKDADCCVFRRYYDVYLKQIHRSNRPSRHRKMSPSRKRKASISIDAFFRRF
jgi:hypothetical protein